MSLDIVTIWQRIQKQEGEVFHTKRGEPFTYKILDGYARVEKEIFSSGTQYLVPRSRFSDALANVPCEGPSEIRVFEDGVFGGSYIWAILHDPKIRQGDY